MTVSTCSSRLNTGTPNTTTNAHARAACRHLSVFLGARQEESTEALETAAEESPGITGLTTSHHFL